MRLIIQNAVLLDAYSNNINSQYYLSNSYTLTGLPIFIEYKTLLPHTYSSLNNYISSYLTNFGDNSSFVYGDSNTPIYHTYNNSGTYYISYSAIFNDNSVSAYKVAQPLIVQDYWKTYVQNQLRLVSDVFLTFPYQINQIYIQPNEWGVSDIFNTAIYRLNENLNYLISNTQTINTDTPTVYFGWMGNNSTSQNVGIRWFTQSYNKEYLNEPNIANDLGQSYFSNLKDSYETLNYVYALDNNNFRVFTSEAIPQEVIFSNKKEILNLLVDPSSMAVDETETHVYICDPPSNRIYKFNIDINSKVLYIQLDVGGFGGFDKNNKFNLPTEISYTNKNVFVVDYNNSCIKQYNKDLSWLYTYKTNELDSDQPISCAAHPTLGLLYILSQSYTVYVYDIFSTQLVTSFSVQHANDKTNLKKIVFDDVGDFFYILTDTNCYKFTSSSIYINSLSIVSEGLINYNSLKSGINKTLIFTSKKCILKCQDVLKILNAGGVLPYNNWSLQDLTINSDEFVTDLNYNRALIRMAQNIKAFRDTLNSKFVIVPLKTNTGIIPKLSWTPIDILDLPKLNSDVESENIGVGVNEFNVPQVLNRELKKLYSSLDSLRMFLDVNNSSIGDINQNLYCGGNFNWYWAAMNCYNLNLPISKNCDINPITYRELTSNFPVDITYVPKDKTWGNAITN